MDDNPPLQVFAVPPHSTYTSYEGLAGMNFALANYGPRYLYIKVWELPNASQNDQPQASALPSDVEGEASVFNEDEWLDDPLYPDDEEH